MTTFNPMDYGAVGDGTTDDAVPLQDCFDAAGVDGGTVIIDRMYATSAAILIPDYVRVAVEGGKGGLRGLGSGTIAGLITAEGSKDAGTGRSLSANAAKWDSVLQMNTGHGLVAGDYIRIHGTISDPGAYGASLTTKLLDATSTSITIDFPLPFVLKTTDTYTIKKLTMRHGISVDDGLVLEKGSATGICRGAWFKHLDETCRIGSLIGRDFTRSSLTVAESYMPLVGIQRTLNCGGDEEAIGFYGVTGMQFSGTQAQQSNNCHLLYFGVNYSHLGPAIGVRPSVGGRGIKFDCCHGNYGAGAIQVQGGQTAISLQQNTADNAFVGYMAFGGKDTNATGINDNYNKNSPNAWTAAVSLGHVFYDVTNLYRAPNANQMSSMLYGTLFNP
jgi:hypothetical protein